MRRVYATTRTVGQCFATSGVIRAVGSKRVVWESSVDRPYGFTSAAIEDARTEIARRGWAEVLAIDPEADV